jgi:limonene-1,2-epoxide hydrolase
MRIDRDVAIPMADGTVLHADVFRPADDGRHPVIMTHGPYAKGLEFEHVEFETVHQAVNGDVVIAEEVHGLALPGGPLAPIMNMAVYEIRNGTIAAWRDYSNPDYARTLLQG